MTKEALRHYVIDTNVLQKANAPLTNAPRARAEFASRLALLCRIARAEVCILISQRLFREYRQQLAAPRNDAVRAFFELLTSGAPGRVLWNWPHWSGSQKQGANRCRFPREDYFVLRTAIRDGRSWIITEEQRMLDTDECIYREFQVHVWHTKYA